MDNNRNGNLFIMKKLTIIMLFLLIPILGFTHSNYGDMFYPRQMQMEVFQLIHVERERFIDTSDGTEESRFKYTVIDHYGNVVNFITSIEGQLLYFKQPLKPKIFLWEHLDDEPEGADPQQETE